MIRFDKLTIKGQEALQAAQNLAESLRQPQMEPEHLLLVLTQQQDGIVPPLLRKLGVAPESLQQELQQHLSSLPRVEGAQFSISRRLETIFRQAQAEADQFKDEYISTEHLLLAISADDGFAGRLLRERGADRAPILKVLV